MHTASTPVNTCRVLTGQHPIRVLTGIDLKIVWQSLGLPAAAAQWDNKRSFDFFRWEQRCVSFGMLTLVRLAQHSIWTGIGPCLIQMILAELRDSDDGDGVFWVAPRNLVIDTILTDYWLGQG